MHDGVPILQILTLFGSSVPSAADWVDDLSDLSFSRREKEGSHEEGKYADLAVWDKNMYAINTDEIKDLQCQMTLFNGEIVFKHPGTKVEITYSGK